jgi:hypothetical protein
MIGLIFDKDSFKILSLFSTAPDSALNRSQIKEKTVMNNVPLDNALFKLLKAKILIRENNEYRLDQDNKNSRRILKVVARQYRDFHELPLNIYFSLIDLADNLSSMKKIEAYLYGFYTGSDSGESSKIDIALLTPKKVSLKRFDRIAAKIEKNYGKKIEIHNFIADDFYKNKGDKLVSDIQQNGIKIL